jgi:hypothetical protein
VDDVESYGPHLVQIVSRLPQRFVSHVLALACGDKEEDWNAEPTGTSPSQRQERRQRDVLPLVFGDVSAEDLPKRSTKFSRHEFECRSAWLFVLLAALNFSFNGGRAYQGVRPLYGPPTQSQYSALVRLYAAADAMVEMNPEKIIAPNREKRLGVASVSYAGEEVTTAEGIVPELLPPLSSAQGCLRFSAHPSATSWLHPPLCRRTPPCAQGLA